MLQKTYYQVRLHSHHLHIRHLTDDGGNFTIIDCTPTDQQVGHGWFPVVCKDGDLFYSARVVYVCLISALPAQLYLRRSQTACCQICTRVSQFTWKSTDVMQQFLWKNPSVSRFLLLALVDTKWIWESDTDKSFMMRSFRCVENTMTSFNFICTCI